MSSCHRSATLAFAGALLLSASVAAAREPATVGLHTTGCDPDADVALRQALEVELRAMRVEPRWGPRAEADAPARYTLRATCDPADDSVALRLWSNEPALLLSRRVALRDVAEPARTRTLALVISEALGPALLGDARDAPAASPSSAPAASARPSDVRERDDAAPVSEPRARPVARGASARGERPRRAGGLLRTNPYAPLELYSTSSPYGMPHGFRIGTGALGRLALRDSSVLLGLELGANGPLSESIDWSLELSHSSSTAWSSELGVSWWSTSLGVDLVDVDAIAVAAGPRLSLGHLSINDPSPTDASTERTLVAQLGFRGKIDVPVGERTSVQVTFSGHRTVGVQALTHYTGLDRELNGWILAWGLGLGLEP